MKVPYFEPWITEQDKSTVVRTLGQRWLTNGPNLIKFERKIAAFIGTKYSAGVGSATQALHLALRSLGIGPGDEVIVPTFTFVATANAVKYCGAKPILTDVDPNTFNINPKEIKKNITKRTRAIILVHYGGQACEMQKIAKIAKNKGLYVLEDCAHSLGSKYKNQKCGSLGDLGCFSFYPTKIITTGEGGMITTNNQKAMKKIKLLRSQAMNVQAKERESKAKWKYDVVDLGYNYRLDEIRASLGLSQFGRIKKINSLRQNIAKMYDKALSRKKGISIPFKEGDRNHIYHLYTIKIEKDYNLTRNELFQKLHDKGIGTSVQYFPLHLMSIFKKDYKNKKNQFKISNILKDKVISLPIYPKMSNKQINYVISNL